MEEGYVEQQYPLNTLDKNIYLQKKARHYWKRKRTEAVDDQLISLSSTAAVKKVSPSKIQAHLSYL